MVEKEKRPAPHPDDFMTVTLGLYFQAKLNPKANEPPTLELTGFVSTQEASNAADYLEDIARAIRERRLYGLMAQKAAESAVGAGEWIEKTAAERFTATRGNEDKAGQKSSLKDTDDV